MDAGDGDAAAHVGAGGFGGSKQGLLHFGVEEGNARLPLWSRGGQFAVNHQSLLVVEVDPGDFVGHIAEQIENAEFPGFGGSPRNKKFAADAVFEFELAFEEEDAGAVRCHVARERSPAEASSDDDEIVLCGHFAPWDLGEIVAQVAETQVIAQKMGANLGHRLESKKSQSG